MASKSNNGVLGGNTQAARRTVCSLHAVATGKGNEPWYDQHRSTRFPDGRPFWCSVEIMADGVTPPMPCTPLTPDGWGSPYLADDAYIDYSGVPYGHFRWRYDRMKTEDQAEWERYYTHAAVIYHERGLGLILPGERPHFAVRAVIGAPPRSPKIAEAFIAGDPWLLGLTPTVNEDLQRQFVLSARGLGEATAEEAKAAHAVIDGGHGSDLTALIDAAVGRALEADRAKRKAMGARLAQGRAKKAAAVATGTEG